MALFIFLLLLTGAGLVVFLWVGTLFFQGYLYTEPAEQLSWRAPAAAGALLLFFALWCLLEANSTRAAGETGNLVIPGFFSPYEDMTPQPVRYLWAVRRAGRDKEQEVKYELHKYSVGTMSRYEYKRADGSGQRWKSSGVEAIVIEVNGQKDRFVPQKGPEGSYRRFVDDSGWSMAEFDTGPTGQPERFRLDWLLGNLFLNLFHLGLWFVCLWLLLRFQWPHALGLAFVLWLVVSLAILPFLLSQARSLAGTAPSPGRKTAERTVSPRPPFS